MRFFHILLERNIANYAEIDKFSQSMAQRATNPGVREWLARMLPAYLKKNYKKIQKIGPNDLGKYWKRGAEPAWAVDAVQKNDLISVVLDHELQQQISEVVDYLESGTAAHNLSRIPFEVALQKSHEWHRDLANQGTVTTTDLGDGIRLYKTYPNGCKWAILTTPACLDAEGQIMQNCVGGGSYDKRVASGELQIFSLRDPNGESHVTAAIKPTEIVEIKGKQNKPPIAKYRPYVIDLLNTLKIPPADHDYDLKGMGIFYGEKGYGTVLQVAHSISDMPDGYKFVQLKAVQNSTCYLTTKDGHVVVAFEMNRQYEGVMHIDGELDRIDVSDETLAKSIRGDVIQIVNGLLQNGVHLGTMADHTLATQFAMFHEHDKLKSLTTAMKLVQRDLIYRMYVRTSAAAFDHNAALMMVVDETDHPIIYSDIKKGDTKLVTGHIELQHGWDQAVPFMFSGMKKIKLHVGKDLGIKLKLAGWYENDKLDWVPANEAVKGAKEVFHTSNDHIWYDMSERNLVLLFNNKIMASLSISSVEKDDAWGTKVDDSNHVYVIDGVDEAFSRNGPFIRDDVAELFDEGIAKISDDDYRWEPFLLYYDVCADRFSNIQAVNWEIPVTVEVETWNTKGDIVSETTHESTLGAASSDIGYDDIDYSLNDLADDVVIQNGGYKHENDYYVTIENPEDYYDNAAEYRRKHKMRPNAKLPSIAKVVTYISRKR